MVKTCYNDDLFEVVNYFVVKVVKKKLGDGQIRAFYKIRPILLIFRLVVYFLLVMRSTSDKGDLNLEVQGFLIVINQLKMQELGKIA